MLNKRYKFGVILLAAGLSSRMQGKNKLLKIWRGQPLLFYSLEIIKQLKAEQCVLVAGHMIEDIRGQFDLGGLHLVHNPRPEQGMASSIVLGMEALSKDIDGVFICLGDMPLVSLHVFQALSDVLNLRLGRTFVFLFIRGSRGIRCCLGNTFFRC